MPYQLSDDLAKWLIGAAAATFAASMAGLWKFMDGHVAHWKGAYQEKNAELATALKHPDRLVVDMMGAYQKTVSSEIERLSGLVTDLQAKCDAKDLEIKKLIAQSVRDEKTMIRLEEEKEQLQRQVDAYRQILSDLEKRQERADIVVHVLDKDGIDSGGLQDMVAEEINTRMAEIEKTSLPRYKELVAQELRMMLYEQRNREREASALAQVREQQAAAQHHPGGKPKYKTAGG